MSYFSKAALVSLGVAATTVPALAKDSMKQFADCATNVLATMGTNGKVDEKPDSFKMVVTSPDKPTYTAFYNSTGKAAILVEIGNVEEVIQLDGTSAKLPEAKIDASHLFVIGKTNQVDVNAAVRGADAAANLIRTCMAPKHPTFGF